MKMERKDFSFTLTEMYMNEESVMWDVKELQTEVDAKNVALDAKDSRSESPAL